MIAPRTPSGTGGDDLTISAITTIFGDLGDTWALMQLACIVAAISVPDRSNACRATG